jgi:hypothetical protein
MNVIQVYCKYRSEATLSVVCGRGSWYLLLVVTILGLKFPHVLVRILQVVIAYFFQDLLQVHLTNKAKFVGCEILTVTNMITTVLNVMQFSAVDMHQCFTGSSFLQLS